MISISRLLCGADAAGDRLRYGPDAETEVKQISQTKQRRPVVVWNCTRQCNLYCEHCYAGACAEPAAGELSTEEGKRLLADLAEYGVPVVLFSGGEPTARNDLEELVRTAADHGLRPVLSTNGTLLTRRRAAALHDAGLEYAGISVDGNPKTNDAFRGQEGAFDAAVRGIESCLDVGLKTGLRYTITTETAPDLENIVELLHDLGVDRFCFYHLSYGGRGGEIVDTDLSPSQRRRAVRRLCDLTRRYHADGEPIETLLVGNYADAAYLVEYARRHLGPTAAKRIRQALEINGGDPAGARVADIDYLGNVHPTQFWQQYSLGNVRDRSFEAIWEDESNPLLRQLRGRPESLSGRCASCRYRTLCGGGSPLRSLAVHGDVTAPDPQCYLHDAEIAPSAD